MSFFQAILNWLKSIFKPQPALIPNPVAPTPVPQPIAPSNPGKLVGIDVYHGDSVKWDDVAAHKPAFLFAKASEGASHVDSFYADYRAQSSRLGIPFGAYHFFRGGVDAIAQAKNFCSVVGATRQPELPMVMDWEDRAATDKSEAQKFLDYVERFSGRTPIIYGGLSFLTELTLDHAFSRYPLWLAHYTSAATTKVPPPWTNWTFWQFAEGGIEYKYDTNNFAGDIGALNKL